MIIVDNLLDELSHSVMSCTPNMIFTSMWMWAKSFSPFFTDSQHLLDAYQYSVYFGFEIKTGFQI